jgi:hypothetical protein
MKAILGAILLFTMFAVTTAAADADRWTLELRAGGAVPTEKVGGGDLDTGFGFGPTLAYRIQPHLHLYGGWGWHRFGAEDAFAVPDVHVVQTGYVYGLRFVHPFSESSSLSYRLYAGGTYEHLEFELGGDEAGDSDHGVGWEAGAGVVVPLGPAWDVNPTVGYRSLSRDVTSGITTTPVDLRYFAFGVGVTRRF